MCLCENHYIGCDTSRHCTCSRINGARKQLEIVWSMQMQNVSSDIIIMMLTILSSAKCRSGKKSRNKMHIACAQKLINIGVAHLAQSERLHSKHLNHVILLLLIKVLDDYLHISFSWMISVSNVRMSHLWNNFNFHFIDFELDEA